jgi:uncharacterized membrane protein YeaQ/YmgE (transglycosylase-associated protein family)
MLFVLFVALLFLFVILPVIGFALWALISAIVVGAIIGMLARLVLPGHAPIGAWATILLGWIGSMVGGFVGYEVLDLSRFPTVLIEIAVAAVLIFAWASADRAALRR